MRTINFPLLQNQHSIIASDSRSIEQGLYLLLNTTCGEIHSDPAFGCGVRNRIFKANDTFNRTMIKEDIYSAIKTFAPYVRVKREDIEVTSKTIAKVDVKIKATSLLDFTTNIYNIEILRQV